MDAKLTPWFPASVNPKRIGWYEISTYRFPAPNFRHWNGADWSQTYGLAYAQIEMRDVVSGYPAGTASWRGLAQKPAKKAKG